MEREKYERLQSRLTGRWKSCICCINLHEGIGREDREVEAVSVSMSSVNWDRGEGGREVTLFLTIPYPTLPYQSPANVTSWGAFQ